MTLEETLVNRRLNKDRRAIQSRWDKERRVRVRECYAELKELRNETISI